MSIKIMTRVWDNSKSKGSALLLLLALADYASEAGYCWPGITTLAGKTRLSERQVMRLIRQLEEAGELVCVREHRKPNRYWITVKYQPKDTSHLKGHTCANCQQQAEEVPLLTHHIIPLELGGQDIPENTVLLCENCQGGLHRAIAAERDKMTPKGDDPLGDIRVTLNVTSRVLQMPQMSPDPSMIRHLTTIKESAADAAPSEEGQEDDAAWLQESRIEGESELEGMSQEDKAKVATPAAQDQPEDPGLPAWEQAMRRRLKGRTLPGDFTPDDVVAYCQRFYDVTSNPPPAHNKGNGNWMHGAIATLESFHGSLVTLYESKGQALPPIENQRRVFTRCVDLFFFVGAGYDHISAPTPRSLANSMASLIGDQVDIHTMYNLSNGAGPDESQIKGWIARKGDKRGQKAQGAAGRSGRPAPTDGGVRGPGKTQAEDERDLAAAKRILAQRTGADT